MLANAQQTFHLQKSGHVKYQWEKYASEFESVTPVLKHKQKAIVNEIPLTDQILEFEDTDFSRKEIATSECFSSEDFELAIAGQPLVPDETMEMPEFIFKDNAKFNIKYLDKAHGFPSNSNYSIVEDQEGFVWIATESKGLFRLSSNRLEIFRGVEGKDFIHINNLFLDHKGRLWLASSAGITYIENDSMYHIITPEIEKFNFETIHGNKNGVIVISTFDDGILRIEKDRIKHINTVDSKLSLIYAAIDNQDNIWCGISGQNELIRLGDNESIVYSKNNGGDMQQIAYVNPTDSVLYFSLFGDGLYLLDNEKISRLKLPKLKRYYVYDMLRCANTLYLPLYGRGAAVIKNKKVQYFNNTNGMAGNNSFTITGDSFGNVWIGDLMEGISRIDDNSIQRSKTLNKIPIQHVVSILKSEYDDSYWFFPNSGLITKLKGNKIYTYTNEGDQYFAQMRHVFKGAFIGKDSVWLGTYDSGVCLLQNDEFLIFKFDQRNFILGMASANFGQNYFATTYNGILVEDNFQFKRITTQQGLSSDQSTFVESSPSDELWYGTNGGGINILNNDSICVLDTACLSSNYPNAIYFSGDEIWVGYRNAGVDIIRGNTVFSITNLSGLVSNNVASVYQDSRKNYWVATDMGLSKINFINDSTYQIFNHYSTDGSIFSDFTNGVNEINSKVIWDSKGLIEYDLNSVQQTPVLPRIIIDSIAGNSNMRVDDIIKLGPLKGSFDVYYSLLCWGDEANTKVYYSFNPVSDESNWESLENKLVLTLDGLHPGIHLLRLKVENKIGVSPVLEFKIFIVPEFYQSAIFKVVLAFLVAALIVLFMRRRISVEQRKADELMRIVDKQTEEIRTEKEQLAKSIEVIRTQNEEKDFLIDEIHHRVKNNLQSISSIIDMQMMSVRTQNGKRILSDIYRRIKAMSMVHEKLNTSHEAEVINARDYLGDLVNSINSIVNVDKIPIKFETQICATAINISDCIAIGMITSEAISNSIKYAFEGVGIPEILVSLSPLEDSKYMILRIKDNGVGIPDEFITGKSDSLGLKLIRIFSTQLKGELTVTNANGTSIEMIFKNGRD